MSKISDGGPAFPPSNPHTGESGMTLRDYFAAKAMNGLMNAWGEHDITDYDDIAADAYLLADAMIAAREVTP